MDTKVLFNIGYGLYILTANEEERDNGCVINSVMQVTSNPCQIAVTLNKDNFTTSMIQRTKKFNLSILCENVGFDVFKRFGYQSGRYVDKFLGFSDVTRSLNGILYLNKYVNSYISAYVQREIDLGTHIMFIAQLVEAEKLSECKTLTYEYYQRRIKPAPSKTIVKGWRCKICNFIYEEDVLPPDFICPICKHGVSDFEKN